MKATSFHKNKKSEIEKELSKLDGFEKDNEASRSGLMQLNKDITVGEDLLKIFNEMGC